MQHVCSTVGVMHPLEHQIRMVVESRAQRPRRDHHDHHDHHDRTDYRGGRVVHQAPTYRPVYAAHERDGHITTAGRRALPEHLYALPPGPEEVRRGILGRVPFDTYLRARAALSRLSMMRHQGTIGQRELDRARHRVLTHWPQIGRG